MQDRVGPPVPPGPGDARPGRGPHEGRYVILRAPRPDQDARSLFPPTHGADTSVWTYMGYGPFRDVAEMTEWMEGLSHGTDPLFMTVQSRRTGEAIGVVSFLAIEPVHRCVEIGHVWYVPAARRTEANTESVYLLLREAFDRCGYRRVEWKCDALNVRSRRAALRLGFTFEGLFRQHRIVKGRNRDTAWFAMLDGEWPARRARMERWLALDHPRPPLAPGATAAQTVAS